MSLKHAISGNEPWLIASSLNPKIISAQKIMIIHKKRMQNDLTNASQIEFASLSCAEPELHFLSKSVKDHKSIYDPHNCN